MPELVTFNGSTKQITVNDGVSTIGVREHLYSAWKRWVIEDNNMMFLPAMRVIGGDPIGGGLYAGDIYFMMNGWQIVLNQPVTLTGILYHDDPISPYVINSGGGVIATVSAITQIVHVPVQVVEGTVNDIADIVADAVAESVAGSIADSIALRSIENDPVGTVGGTLKALEQKTEEIDADLISVSDILGMLVKYQANRTKIDPDAKTLTVYDDDGVTPHRIFQLKNFAGTPSVTEVAERSPQ